MKRLVIKVGTAVLTEDNKKLALDRIQNLVKLIAKLKNEKNLEVILVSSDDAVDSSINPRSAAILIVWPTVTHHDKVPVFGAYST